MTLPEAVYWPQGQFAFKRSYCLGLWVRHDPGIFDFTDGLLQFEVGVPPNALCKVQFKPQWVEWSSNRSTLDWIIDSATYERPPNPTLYDLPFDVVWMYPPDTWRACVMIDVRFGGLYDLIELPPSPTDYWLPPPL